MDFNCKYLLPIDDEIRCVHPDNLEGPCQKERCPRCLPCGDTGKIDGRRCGWCHGGARDE